MGGDWVVLMIGLILRNCNEAIFQKVFFLCHDFLR